MVIVITGKTGTIGKYFPESTYGFKTDLTKDIDQEIKLISRDSFSMIHTAAVVGEKLVRNDLDYAFSVNVKAAGKLAELSLAAGVSKFLYVSTSHVYKISNSLVSENSEIQPVSTYAKQKREAELELLKIFNRSPEKLIIARVFSVLDWRMKSPSLGSAIEKLVGGEIEYLANGNDERDFLTPKSVSEILLLLVNSNSNGIINVCTSHSTNIREAAEVMLSQINRTDLLNRITGGYSDIPRIIGDNRILKNILPDYNYKWQPDFGS